MVTKFRINLAKYHKETGLTAYAVWKGLEDLGVKANKNTVRSYVDPDTEDGMVVVSRIEITVIQICRFFGLDWRDRDTKVIEVVEVDEDGHIIRVLEDDESFSESETLDARAIA
jgi:hypothetical protein